MYTNKHELPEEVVKALTKNRYNKGTQNTDFSATDLINPVQQTILRKRYPECTEGDVIDLVWSMFGSIAHELLSEHGSDDGLCEQRYYTEINGITLSGQLDLYKDKTITDYKVTSAYKIMRNDFSDWENQLNIYAFLCRIHNLDVESVRIISIIRDWSEHSIMQTNYPKSPIHVIQIPLWDNNTQYDFINERIRILIENGKLTDEELIECNQKDMWQDDDKFAIMKHGAKRATRLCDTIEEAEQYLEDNMLNVSQYDIVVRKNEPRRCNKYCSVSTKCCQYKRYAEMESTLSRQKFQEKALQGAINA